MQAGDPQAGETAVVAVPTSADEAGDNVTSVVDQIVSAAAKLPRKEFDHVALATSLGNDPHKHFEWVRDHTSWAPYRGVLRGSKGVMIDRLGSNADRAVLLGDLLRHAGHTVRLARATISEAEARELLGKLRPAADRRPAIEDASGVKAEARNLLRSQTEAVLAAVRESAPSGTNAQDAAFAALRDHWWVERQDGGKWIAMDVLLPDAKAGDSVASPSSHIEWKSSDETPSIPDGDWHTVTMRVVVERYEAGETKEFAVLETEIRPADIFDRPMTLSHGPVPWPAVLPDPGQDPQPLRDAALAVNIWVPALQVGDQQIVQSGFTSEGEIKKDLADNAKEIAKVGGAKVASGMDMALGGFGAEETTPAATAEWIDYEIRAPGVPDRKLRRQVFDLLGPARRASRSADFDGTADLRKLERFDALWAQTDVMLQPCEFTPEFIAHMMSTSVVANQAALKELAREDDAGKAGMRADELVSQLDMWGPLPELVLWRAVLDDQTRDAFIDQVNVLHYRVGRSIAGSGPTAIREQIDVASNPSGVRHGSAASPFEVRVRQGVADTVAEMLALGNDLDTAPNTASVFGRLAADKSRGMLIAANDEAAVRALPWPEDEMARVGADVSAGYMVVVPRQAVLIDDVQHVAWWRINPETGETVGVMDNGFHNSSLEGKVITIVVALAPILGNPLVQQRIDRIGIVVARYGGAGLTRADIRLWNVNQMYNQLMGGLEWLSRNGR